MMARKFNGSEPLQWDGWYDLGHLLLDAALVGGAVVCEQAIQTVVPWLNEHAGYWGPTVGALAGTVLFGLKRWLTDTRTPAA